MRTRLARNLSRRKVGLIRKVFSLFMILFLLNLQWGITALHVSANSEADFTTTPNPTGVTITDYTGSTKDVIIPATINGQDVTSIGKGAFALKQLTSVVIPNSVTSIGEDAFNSNQLTSVVIPNSVISIGERAFYINQLTSVVIPDSVTSIENATFSDNQLTSVVIPNSVINIEEAAFWINQLTNVVIPDSVTSIGTAAFANNQLTSVVIPDRLSSIAPGAFMANQLTSVEIPTSVTSIGADAFRGNQLTSVNIPDSVSSIEAGAFRENQLTSVVIPNSVNNIGNRAFSHNQLTSVVIPDSVTSIGVTTFANNQLNQVEFKGAVSTISPDAFANQTNNGRSFYDWFTDQTYSNTWEKVVLSPMTIYAQWPVQISYDGNGATSGDVPTDNETYKSGESITLASNTGNLKRVGYTFIGWNTKQDGSGDSYLQEGSFTFGQEDVTLYAQWAPISTGPITPTPTPTPEEGSNNGSKSIDSEITEQLKSPTEGPVSVEIKNGDSDEVNARISQEILNAVVDAGRELEISFNGTTLTIPKEVLADILNANTEGYMEVSIKLGITVSSTNLNLSDVIELTITRVEDDNQTLVTQFSEKISVSLPLPGDIKDKDKVAVYYIDEETGTLHYVQSKVVGDKIVFKTSHFSKFAIVEQDVTFNDLVKYDWARQFIESLAAKSIIKGKADGIFAPGDLITREEFTVLLARALDIPKAAYEGVFADVKKANAWSVLEVEAAYRAGIVFGYEGKFDPKANITREQIVTMIIRALNYDSPNALKDVKPLKALEQELQVALFERDHTKVEVSQAGHQFYKMARKLLEEVEDTKHAIRHVGNKDRIPFVIALSNNIIIPTLLKKIQAFQETHTHYDIQILLENRQQFEQALRNRKWDVVISDSKTKSTDLHSEQYTTSFLQLVYSSQIHLGVNSLDHQIQHILQSYPLYVGYLNEHAPILEQLQREYSIERLVQVENEEFVYKVVKQGLAATIAPSYIAENDEQLRMLDIGHIARIYPIPIYISHIRQNELVQPFLQYLRTDK